MKSSVSIIVIVTSLLCLGGTDGFSGGSTTTSNSRNKWTIPDGLTTTTATITTATTTTTSTTRDVTRSKFLSSAVATAAITVTVAALGIGTPSPAWAKDDAVKGTKKDPEFEACLSKCMYECTKPKGVEQKTRAECLPECKQQCATTKAKETGHNDNDANRRLHDM